MKVVLLIVAFATACNPPDEVSVTNGQDAQADAPPLRPQCPVGLVRWPDGGCSRCDTESQGKAAGEADPTCPIWVFTSSTTEAPCGLWVCSREGGQ